MCLISDAKAQVNRGSCVTLLGSSQSQELFTINTATNTATLIGNMAGQLATEIEYDTVNDLLYGEEINGFPNLHTIDPATAASTGTVTHANGSLTGLEFVGGTLYGTFIAGSGAPSDLVIVDTNTGNFTVVGPTGQGPISGLAYDTVSRIMYGVTAGGGPANLLRINLLTGAATVIGATGMDRIGSIEFGPQGVLYGGTTDIASVSPSSLVRIDVNTGNAQAIFNTGFSITGLAAIRLQDEACIPKPVPALSRWGLALSVLLLLGLVTFRRRSRLW